MAAPSRVLLLKGTLPPRGETHLPEAAEEASGDSTDGADAVSVFGKLNYAVDVIAPLTVMYTNNGTLQDCLMAGANTYGGIIFTSPRAVAAVVLAGQCCTSNPRTIGKSLIPANWAVYAVGPRTAEECRKQLERSPRGGDSGDATALAKFIEQDYDRRDRPLLFACGDRALPTLPAYLKEHGLRIQQIVVYETRSRPDMASVFRAHEAAHPNELRWVAFYSPSGVAAARANLEHWTKRGIRLAAIGPTTAAALASAEYPPTAVAVAPTLESLAAALSAADAPAS